MNEKPKLIVAAFLILLLAMPLYSQANECSPRLNIDIRSKLFDLHAGEISLLLSEKFCEIRASLLRKPAERTLYRDRLLKYLDGKKAINIVIEDRTFAHSRIVPLIPWVRKTIHISPLVLFNGTITVPGTKKDGTEVEVTLNPRLNLNYILLHELVHIAGRFRAGRESDAISIASYYFPIRGLYIKDHPR